MVTKVGNSNPFASEFGPFGLKFSVNIWLHITQLCITGIYRGPLIRRVINKLPSTTGLFFPIFTKLKEIWPKLKQNFPKSTQNIQFFFESVKFFLEKLEKGSKFRSKLKEICRKLKFTGVFVTRGEPKNRE